MATSAMVGGAGEPHWLDEEVTKEFLKNKMRWNEEDADEVFVKLNARKIRDVRDLLEFSEDRLRSEVQLEPALASRIRNYIEGCKVDETFLKTVLRLENSELLQVRSWLNSKRISDVGRLVLKSRDDLQGLDEGTKDVLLRFIEKQKGKLYCSKYYWEYSHTNISDESQLKSQLILVFLKHLMSQLIISFL